MRDTVDPSADAVASSLCERGAHRLVGELIKHRQMWDADGAPSRLLPEDIRTYMNAASTLPVWRAEQAIAQAEAFLLLYGLASATLLACASLPQCYVIHDALPAALTRKLVGRATADALAIPTATGLTWLRLEALLDTWLLAASVKVPPEFVNRWFPGDGQAITKTSTVEQEIRKL